MSDTVFCATCGGEFDRCEWESDTRCPECEEPKVVIATPKQSTLPVEGDA